MSAIEETTAAAAAGKDTHAGGGQPSGDVGGVHPDLVRLGMVHLPYGDAVYIMLDQAGLTPNEMVAGLRTEDPKRGPELVLTLSWEQGHPDLHDPAGLELSWSHLTGWAARIGLDVKSLPVQDLAAPHVLADAVLHLSVSGIAGAWMPEDRLARWADWRALDAALTRAAERGQIAW
ncbi:hypothetical protein [Streptomyces stelliscabiei]|uniref:hypothetical protein n=1 Tax=Streptomyces stelliscabiei TaxID=146820 RepID=UPI0029A031F6|nr:hypothetical protein [Streptomyces stelliscabiei]MDX2667427.1 hypothetical protein [Streptomyces stelliscabiei]MDX2785966.1 hypothetical protein [Streptomyces stelliscabiei]